MIGIPRHSRLEPNRKQYIEILRKMTGEERVRIGFELFEMTKHIMIEGIIAQHPGIKPEEIQQEMVRRMLRCHRRNSSRRSLRL